MIILDRTQSSHTLNIIPRNYSPTGSNIFKIVITNEEQNTEVSNVTVSSLSAVKYYYSYTANLGLDSTKDLTYILEVTDTATSKVIYRDKIFGTDQTVSTYSPNTGRFTQNPTAANDFLVYE